MLRRTLTLMAVLAIAVTGVAYAAKTKTIKIGGTMNAAIVKIGAGGKATIAGVIQDRALGSGAVVFPQAGVGKGAKTKFTAFTDKGALKGRAVSDNSATGGKLTIANGKLTITSGTGRYVGAKGTGTFSGTQDQASSVLTLKYKGTVKIKK
jgi:hypothetical protein